MTKFKALLNMYIDKHTVLTLFILHAFFIALSVLALHLFFKVNQQLFLTDDGYYAKGKLFSENKSLSSLFDYTYRRGPVLPLLFSILNLSPSDLHPYLRIALTLIFTLGNLYIAFKLFVSFMSNKAIFYGLFISLFNPLYIHWTLKSTPEVYLTFFMCLIIFGYIRFLA